MPRLTPTLPQENVEIVHSSNSETSAAPQVAHVEKTITLNSNAIEVLRAAGVDQRRGRNRMSPLLIDAGLGLEECARKLSTFVSYSEDESIQFNATKLALQLHGELDKDGGEKNSGVQINFVGVTPDLLQVLIPR